MAAVFLMLAWVAGVHAQQSSAPVSLGVDPTRLVIAGCASPSAFVQLFNDNSPIGTVVANAQGRFSKTLTFPAQQNGLRNIRIYYDDTNGRTSSIVTSNVNLAGQTTTTINQILPTTIEHEPEPIAIGNFLIFRGTTCPNALVNVRIDNNLTLAAQADAAGNWYIIADSTKYYAGAHVYEALSSLKNDVSQSTNKYQFVAIGPGGGGDSAELTPPSITEPTDLFLSSTPTVTIRGTGPANAQLELFVDDALAGSVFVNAEGEWSFQMNMSDDLQTVTARTCLGSRCSGFGNSVRIRFGGDLAACSAQVTMQRYRWYGLSPDGGLDIELGNLPADDAELLMDWGDTSVEHITLNQANDKLHHVYKQSGHYGGVATVRFGDCVKSLYFSVIVSAARPGSWWVAPAATGWFTVWLGWRWQKNRPAQTHPPSSGGPPKRWYSE